MSLRTGRAARPWPSWAYRVLLPVLSVTLTLALGEGLCRWFGWGAERPVGFRFYVRNVDGDVEETYNREDPDLMWAPAPGEHDGGLYRISAEGFRGGVPSGDGPLVACLGDSSTFGVDTPEDATWPRRLAARLPGWRVLNGGVTGYTVEQVLRRYRRDVRPLRPKAVVVYVGINDPVDRFWLSDREILDRHVPSDVSALETSWLMHLQLYRALRAAAAGWFASRPPVPRVDDAAFAERLATLAQEVHADGARLVLVVPPVDPSRRRGWPRGPAVARYQALLRAAQADAVVSPELPAGTGFIDLVHPSPIGHDRVAAAVAAALRP